ncbi:MAG: hypothetical protein KC561_20520, partial [Myxococcales bacterium]|nr:hypothetical protein [Myxococcales bacterium]
MSSLRCTRMFMALLVGAALSCSSDPDADLCGSGDQVTYQSESYCVFPSELIIEGFRCPDDLPNFTDLGGLGGICSRDQLGQDEIDGVLGNWGRLGDSDDHDFGLRLDVVDDSGPRTDVQEREVITDQRGSAPISYPENSITTPAQSARLRQMYCDLN